MENQKENPDERLKLPSEELIALKKSEIHGNGIVALRDIPKGTVIIEYAGTLRTHTEVDGGPEDEEDTGHTFLFTLNDLYVIDGATDGNLSRWINNGCDPNCEALVTEDPGKDLTKDRVFIEALRDIRAGEELTYDYGITWEKEITEAEKILWACRCGAANCKGTMLTRVEETPAEASSGAAALL